MVVTITNDQLPMTKFKHSKYTTIRSLLKDALRQAQDKTFEERPLGQRGLTMIELLVVITILAVLIIILMWFLRNQPYKARDAKRKADLKQYQVAFEDYFNDHERYPDEGAINNCNSTDLAPYINSIRCDPRPGDNPYNYIVATDGTWFAVCADLENDSDPDIAKIGCNNGCGTDLAYDYCAVQGVTISGIGGSISGEGLGPAYAGAFACDAAGACNNYGTAQAARNFGCPRSWAENDCQGLCTLPAYTAIPPAVVNPTYKCN